MAIDWSYYKYNIPVPEIQELCDMATELEEAKKRVERGMKRKNLYSEDYRKMQSLMKRLIYKILGVIRKVAKSVGKEEKIEEKGGIVDNLNNLLKFGERDKVDAAGELKAQTPNYPFININAMDRVEEVLYVYLADVLKDTLSVRKVSLMDEFIISAHNRRGVTVSPEFMKALEEKGKLMKMEE